MAGIASLPASWAGVPAESAAAFYAALPAERTAYYLARWQEASQQYPGKEGEVFRWHLAILEPDAAPAPGAQLNLF